jgi:hypothetical protein
MTDGFLTKLVLSFLAGGVWVTIATRLADKHGTRIGGFIIGLPSTALISLFFIGWTQSPAAAVKATDIVPMIGAVNALFLLLYIALVRTNFWLALSSSLLLWGLLCSVVVVLKPADFYLSLVIYFLVVSISFFIIEKGIKVESTRATRTVITSGPMVFRGLFSGTIIALAVVMGKVGGPLLGGMFAMFPAMFTGTLLITYFTHGHLFSSAMMKVALISAVSLIFYALLVRATYIPLGLIWGTGISIIGSFAAAGLLHIFIVKRIS